jgi:hypothetical protein
VRYAACGDRCTADILCSWSAVRTTPTGRIVLKQQFFQFKFFFKLKREFVRRL